MLKLIHYEYRKLFFRRSILITIIIFSIIDIFKINNVYQQNSLLADKSTETSTKWENIYWELYNEFSGVITKDKIDKLLKIYRPLENEIADITASTRIDNPNTYTGNVYSDYYLLKWLYVQPMEYAYMYKSRANNIVNNARNNMKFFKKLGNEYEYKKNVITANLFANRVISNFAYLEMYQSYLHYDFSILLILFLCLYGIVNVFVNEKESQMNILLLTSIYGGKRTTTAKIIATSTFIVGITLWFLILDFICFSIAFNSFVTINLPIYTIQNFLASSINITIGQYIVISGIFKMIGMLVIGMMFLFISEFFKNALLPFITNLSIILVIIFLCEKYRGSGYIINKVINPFILLINRELFGKIEFVNIFGVPMLSYIVAIVFAGCLLIISIILIYKVSKKNVVNIKKGGIS
ncbi:ABC transporter permease [Vallitalea guaymasensis]|uniref:ABC transporter permease n=1 Tax=Vallitalea guaymasensis TaxID=1185412 RepID=UPI00272A2ADA|nr:ABC transporter permease [Vallitalea guaymasensis]